jgi:hypothetical protein
MARKKPKLCWGDLADICCHQLKRLGAFVPDCCDQLEMDGEGLKEPATLITDSEGKSFTLIYAWHDRNDNVTTVRCRVKLAQIKRPFGLETVIECPDCFRKCQRLALRPFGLQCAKCGPIVSACSRAGKVARLVWRANLTSYKLGMNSWAGLPQHKPKHMSMKRYVALLDQRAAIVNKIGAQLARRRRYYGPMPLHAADYHAAVTPLPANYWSADFRADRD